MNVRTNEKNNIENFMSYLKWSREPAGPPHRLRPKNTGSDRLRNTGNKVSHTSHARQLSTMAD